MVVAHPETRLDEGSGPSFWFWGTRGGRVIKAPVEACVVAGGTPLRRVIIGDTFALALRSDGTLASWGCDCSGCLGLGRWQQCVLGAPRAIALPLESGHCDVVDVQLGARHILALSRSGRLHAWGDNRSGQLGLGDLTARFDPAVIETLRSETIVQVLAVSDSSYALTDKGVVYSWGGNVDGALVLEHSSSRVTLPEPMSRLRGVTKLELLPGPGRHRGNWTIVAYAEQDSVESSENEQTSMMHFWLWGIWGSQRITVPFRPWVAHKKSGTGQLRQVAVGLEYFIVLWENGTLASWGRDGNGCLGLGDQLVSAGALTVSLGEDPEDGKVIDLQHGRRHLLALTGRGQVYAWGSNLSGQLGLGDVERRFKPTCIEALRIHVVVQVLAVNDASYALTDAGLVYAWGDNQESALAIQGAAGERALEPHLLALRAPVTRLDVQLPL